MLIDTHAHVNFTAFKKDAEKVIKTSLEEGVGIINVGSQYSTSKRAVEMAEKYEKGIYSSIGMHPIYAKEKFEYEKFKKLAREFKKVVSVGEIGLDYKPEYLPFKQKQKVLLYQQLNLARELNLPIIFHCRMAHRDLLEILKREKGLTGVIHCFTGNWNQGKKYLEMGFYLGFNGLIFKMNFDQIIQRTPLEKILIETDCPYLTPLPVEGRNRPVYVKYVAEKIAKIKKMSYEKIAEVTVANTRNLFKIKATL